MMRAPSVRLVFQAGFGLVATALLAFCALSAVYTFQRWQAAQRAQSIVGVSRDLFTAMDDLRLERGLIAAALESGGLVSDHARVQVGAARSQSAAAIAAAAARLRGGEIPQGDADAALLAREQLAFQAARGKADQALGPGGEAGQDAQAAAWIAADDRLVDAMTQISTRLSALIRRQDEFTGRMVTFAHLAWTARAAAGTNWLMLHRALLEGRPLSPAEREIDANLRGRVDAAWTLLSDLDRLSDTPARLTAGIAQANRLYFANARARREALLADLGAGRPATTSAALWMASAAPGLASLTGVAITAFDQASAHAKADAVAARRLFLGVLVLMGAVVGLGWAASLFLVQRFVRPMARVTAVMGELARGELSRRAPYLGRTDEIGALAQALEIFRENALAKAWIEAELRRTEVARAAAEAASQIKSQFLANMSHEIRTPLNGVLGMVQAMEREDASPAQRQRLRIIRDSGESLLQILNDVLDLSKIEADKLELDPEPFDLGELVRRTCAVFADAAAAKGLTLRCEVAPRAEGVWEGDPARIRQMLMNLLSNALKFTGQGAVTVRVTRSPSGLRLMVRDTGPGIPAEHRPRLFGKFSQADESITRRFGGAGLGLAICRELAILMGGDIRVASVLGEGSAFTLRLPLPRLQDAAAPPHEVAAAAAGPPVGAAPLRILAAEDNPTNQRVLTALLTPLGAELTLVSTGREAIEAWRNGDWDLILMDIQMPEMSGVEATRRIRAAEAAAGGPRTPIVAVSANAMQHQIDEYRAAGVDVHVSKPIQMASLFAAIEEAVTPAPTASPRAVAG